MPVPLRALAPAPPRQPVLPELQGSTCFFDLPPELRIEIYNLALESITIHILPHNSPDRHCPLALVLTSRQVRNEVLPIIHSNCEIRANVTDFNFEGMLSWIQRIPPDQEANLRKNDKLSIQLHTTIKPGNFGDSLRRWLHLRADACRPQPRWRYEGPVPKPKVANELRRRVKRMTESGKRKELSDMLEAIGIQVPPLIEAAND